MSGTLNWPIQEDAITATTRRRNRTGDRRKGRRYSSEETAVEALDDTTDKEKLDQDEPAIDTTKGKNGDDNSSAAFLALLFITWLGEALKQK